MALIRVAQYNSTPKVVEDYQAQNAHLQAFTNQLLTQQFILDSGTAKPVIKQGSYVSHGGSLYVADADTSITGSPSNGSVYIRVSGTTSLTVEFINNISGYAWNPVYSALTSGSYTLLPYLIVKASTVWTRYNFNPNNQSFGDTRLNSLAVLNNATVGGTLGVTSNITVGGTVDGHDINSELNTLNGRVNQGVTTTSSPTFNELTVATINTGQGVTEVFVETYHAINTTAVSKTATLATMAVGETRRVYATMNVGSNTTHTIYLPTGGKYASATSDAPQAGGSILFTYTSGASSNLIERSSLIWRIS